MVTQSPTSSRAGHDQRQSARNRNPTTHRERCPVRSHGCYGSAVLRGVCNHHIIGSSRSHPGCNNFQASLTGREVNMRHFIFLVLALALAAVGAAYVAREVDSVAVAVGGG
jgi:hypothetical protein